MRRLFLQLLALLFALNSISCKKSTAAEPKVELPPAKEDPVPVKKPTLQELKKWLVDQQVTDETAALFYNLKEIAKTKILFGHQDATKRGMVDANTEWTNEQHMPAVSSDRSDVKAITGAYPAVYGHDFGHISGFFDPGVWFNYELEVARKLTIEAYNRGGINTYSWHYNNPVSKGSFYWTESPVEAVGEILPGGSSHDTYKASLKVIADFAKSLKGADGKLVPVIFRPFHEFDGDWFWWGKAHCSVDEYKKLYQFTVQYLRDELGVHSFLYAWSPDRNFNSEAEFLSRYPGDDFVDLVGSDNYEDLKAGVATSIASAKLKIVSDYALKKNKLAALTETGLQNLSKADWYTQNLLKVLQYQKLELSYVLVWANRKNGYWTPYSGHPAETDFTKFKNSTNMMFGDKLPNMYVIK